MIEFFIFRVALLDYLRLRRIWIWIVLGFVSMAIATTWRNEGGNLEEVYAQVMEGMVFKILALASAIFTTSIVSQEVEQKTIAYLLTRPVERWRLLLARFLASTAITILLGVFITICVSFGTFQGEWSSNSAMMRDFVAVVFGAFGYGALFLLISLMVNRAMIVCLLFAFGWETAIPNMPGEVYYLSIFSYVKAIADHVAFQVNNPLGLLAGALGTTTIARGTAMAVLSLVAVGLVTLSCWWFSSFEYVPREDAE